MAAPVEPPRLEPVGLPPEQAAQKRAALARTAAAKKIGTPEPEHDDRIKPIRGYEDPPPSITPEAFLDLQREIAAKTDAEEAPTSKPARTRAAKTKARPGTRAAPAPREGQARSQRGRRGGSRSRGRGGAESRLVRAIGHLGPHYVGMALTAALPVGTDR